MGYDYPLNCDTNHLITDHPCINLMHPAVIMLIDFVFQVARKCEITDCDFVCSTYTMLCMCCNSESAVRVQTC